jgi:hypothetical protein
MRKNLIPLGIFIALSLTIPLFIIVFENLSSFMYIPSRQWNIPFYPIDESGEVQHENYLVLKVSPNFPLLFWRLITYDYYDSFRWRMTTLSTSFDPSQHPGNATKIFTVELNATTDEFYLPTPSPTSMIFNLTLSPNVKFRLFFDETAGFYKIRITESVTQVKVVYKVSWNSLQIQENTISLNDTPEDIRKTYLQLPDSLPVEVKLLAQSLENSTFNVFDQTIHDVEYIINNFEYDLDLFSGRTQRVIFRDWVLTFLNRKKGICIDSATALTVILRCQGIPARVCCGFKPSRIVTDNVLYYSIDAHALTEVYLPPYGWVQFDATPTGDLEHLPEDVPPFRPRRNQGPPIYLLRTLTPDILIRREENQIKGLITTNINENINASVRIFLDNQTIATVKTDTDGSFTYVYKPDEELRKRTLTFDVESKNLTLKQEVQIVARTYLNATIIKKESFGNLLIISAHLFDDKMLPLKGQTITIENLKLSSQTDNDGKAEFSLDFPQEILPEDISYIVSFRGSNEYLGSSASTKIISAPNPIIFLFIFTAVCVVILKENLIPKSFIKDFRKKDSAKVLTKTPDAVFSEKDFKKISSQLRICFPEIGDSLPKIWGIKDKLLIKCYWEKDSETVSQDKLRVFVNGNCVFEKIVDGNRSFAFYHVFDKKGLQKISAALYDESNNLKEATEMTLCIVDYREEIIRLYQMFLHSLLKIDVNVKDYMTAREIEHLSQRIGADSLIAGCITECFEEAEYSHHSISRKNYEKIYLALKESKVYVD